MGKAPQEPMRQPLEVKRLMPAESTPVSPRIALTPTGTQSAEVLMLRRAIVAGLNILLYFGLAFWAWSLLGAGGWTLVDILLFICFLLGTPWAVLGFWNALIGLWLLHSNRDAMADVAPFAALDDPAAPIALKTAIFMTLRNEDPTRALHRMKLIKAEIDASGFGEKFAYFLLSDTNKDDVAAIEAAGVAKWKAEAGEGAAITYRRREDNTGFKAGNVRDFLENWGHAFDLMLPLDADSLMDAKTILHHVRIMQANPKLGILQSLVVGMPSRSAFARIFQFGMRQGMRTYTMGQAWWVGDCGPFWGHNALARIAPFRDQCELPVLPGEAPFGGHILSHDQVEATFMRRAGYEVRVMPEEGGSWEENPPTLLEFMKRNTRWCQGNLQYFKLLNTPNLYPVSRFQLIWAILMFLGIPAWTFMLPLAALKPFDSEGLAGFSNCSALTLYILFTLMNLMPKIAGLIDIVLTPGGTARYGGTPKFLFAGITEIGFAWILGASDTFKTTVFIVGLIFGKSITWGGQARDAHGVPWDVAAQNLWPQTLFGVVVVGLMAATSLEFALWALPLTFGFLIAIPFAVISADPGLGETLVRNGLYAIPEEIEKPEIVLKAQLGETV
ncbi:MAG: glucan biosynthesis glucosyltransferase H [Rhizobiales bacterium PAR1]|nr:MAG: glucan biosynthesis glucosyltransferase H [Rhizobiales bacterium PAR1]